jgi:cytochrome c
MKAYRIPAVLACALLAAPAAFANEALAVEKKCMQCHSIDQKRPFPAYKDIAAKYAGRPGMVDKLAKKIMEGGTGSFGVLTMPPNAQVNDAEAKQLAAWILSLK